MKFPPAVYFIIAGLAALNGLRMALEREWLDAGLQIALSGFFVFAGVRVQRARKRAQLETFD